MSVLNIVHSFQNTCRCFLLVSNGNFSLSCFKTLEQSTWKNVNYSLTKIKEGLYAIEHISSQWSYENVPTHQNNIPKTSRIRPQKTSWPPQNVLYETPREASAAWFLWNFFDFSWLQLYIRHCTAKVN